MVCILDDPDIVPLMLVNTICRGRFPQVILDIDVEKPGESKKTRFLEKILHL